MESIEQESESPESPKPQQFAHEPESREVVEKMLESVALGLVQKTRSDGFDITNFTDTQKDTLLGIMQDNERNASDYHRHRLDTIKDIKTKQIDASIVNQKTLRYVLIIGILLLTTITLIILLMKEEYFHVWLAFITGLLGGLGISRLITTRQGKAESSSDKSTELDLEEL